VFTKHRFRAGGGGRGPRRLSLQLSAGAAACSPRRWRSWPTCRRCSRGWRRVGTLSIAHCVWRCRAKARCCSRWPRRAVFINAVGGQNSTWTAALFGGGLLGLLIYKPQLGLLIPVTLLAGRHWRASKGVAVSLGERDVAYLFALLQNRRFRSHENIDRVRRAQGLALVLIPVLIAFRPKIEAAIIYESKPAPPDEIIHLLDQLYILGVAGGLILQMVAMLQANQRSELAANANETARSSYNSIVRQRLSDALRYCDDAIPALMKLTRTRTV